MTRITRLDPIESIKPDDPLNVTDDGTILKPVPYFACDVTFDDGITVQVERPLSPESVAKAYAEAVTGPDSVIDGVRVGDVLPTAGPL